MTIKVAAWLEMLSPRPVTSNVRSSASEPRPHSVSELFTNLFSQHHPAAAAPEPSRGWRWVDYGDLTALDEAGQG